MYQRHVFTYLLQLSSGSIGILCDRGMARLSWPGWLDVNTKLVNDHLS